PERVVAVPGQYTTATVLLKLYLGDDVPIIVVPFEKIPKVVLEGQADLGLLIHEGPITYEALGLTKVMDLGERWFQETRLPLPLGVNVVRRDLGEDLGRKLSEAVRASIRYAHAHRDEAMDYALRYGRGMDAEACRRFVEIYVNDYAMALGGEGLQALRYLYRLADGAGLLRAPALDII
ncbi:MAG: ABC transporter substrate-binding protein, partial [Candidatus Rokubacteria bacterium]|nr:ABC transporter substrate-binding protein [Candidatus Rokubacteria bacterium]